MPTHGQALACHCGIQPVAADLQFVIAHLPLVIAGLTRNPVSAWHWIPDVETPDLIRGRDDSEVGPNADQVSSKSKLVLISAVLPSMMLAEQYFS